MLRWVKSFHPCVNMTGDRVSVLKNGFSMDEELLLIAKKVIFDSARMTLANGNKIIKISESETNLLLAFHRGIYKKKISLISSGRIVRVVFQNRVITSLLIKCGIIFARWFESGRYCYPSTNWCFVVTAIRTVQKQRSEAGEQASDTARGKDSRQTHLAEGKNLPPKYVFWC